jgi:hypothetical protein
MVLGLAASPKALTIPPICRTGLRAFGALRIGRQTVRPCEILAERKLRPCLCHLTKGQTSCFVAAFFRPMSALRRDSPTLVGR